MFAGERINRGCSSLKQDGSVVVPEGLTQEDYRRLFQTLGARLGADNDQELRDILVILQRLGLVQIFANRHTIRVTLQRVCFEIVRAKDPPGQ